MELPQSVSDAFANHLTGAKRPNFFLALAEGSRNSFLQRSAYYEGDRR